jgi:hypothetical protein
MLNRKPRRLVKRPREIQENPDTPRGTLLFRAPGLFGIMCATRVLAANLGVRRNW